MEQTTPALITEVTRIYAYNHTYQEYCVMEKTILRWLNVITEVVGLAGNAAVVWFLGFRILRNAISVYILNLAVADFLYLCFQLIYSLIELIIDFHNSMIYVPYVSYFVIYYFHTAGLSFLSVISLERCLSVLCPIWYWLRRPKHVSSFMCLLVWVILLMFTVLQFYYCAGWGDLSYRNWCQFFRCSHYAFLGFLLSLLTGSILVLAVRMFCGSKRMSLTRLYVTILLTVLVFIFCGLPYCLSWLLIEAREIDIYVFSCYFIRLMVFLSCVNSCANPIIYFFVGSFRQPQRQTLKQVLQRALQDTPEDNERRGRLSQGTLEMSRRAEQ
ncbi:mas-related G-protein coupled receptor member A-like [Perognathus longimembris pacificus]|uniref:mas-related G-protein coupled receptor member A-like n=1 Tax=Perognathus longimembris pacificus TaxID=214514 RepID=UPI00201A09B8|nr:mas-related G-protein coupled receptor member A-like [Perognathus longimembris pacificus]